MEYVKTIYDYIWSKKMVVAIQDFKSQTSVDLSVKQGDKLKIVKTENLWHKAVNINTNKSGYIPVSHVADSDTLESERWYFGDICRVESEELLLLESAGTFLVRMGRLDHDYTLSIRTNQKVCHYKILNCNGFYISKELKFNSLNTLIASYINDTKGYFNLVQRIINPCPKPLLPLYDLSSMYRKDWIIKRNDIKFQVEDKLGSGHYGSVYKGYWKNQLVAVKQILNISSREEFIKEVEPLKKLIHKNVISMHGMCETEFEYFIIFEFIEPGSLLDFKRFNDITEEQKMYIALQICEGMLYIHSKNIIHRDLATRNLLINKHLAVKISDFGLSRNVDADGRYICTNRHAMAIEWQAIECFDDDFYKESDVWSYGIVLIELYSTATKLYPVDSYKLHKYLKQGKRIQQPDCMPCEIYRLAYSCWSEDIQTRPSFKDLFDFFNIKCSIDR